MRAMMGRRLRVAVVFGGRSTEHAISCVSAGSVLSHLDRTRFEVIPVGISPAGAWVLASDEPNELAIRDRTLPAVDGTAAPLTLPGDPTVFPGHWYSAEPSASLSEVKRSNYVYRAADLDQWRMLMGG